VEIQSKSTLHRNYVTRVKDRIQTPRLTAFFLSLPIPTYISHKFSDKWNSYPRDSKLIQPQYRSTWCTEVGMAEGKMVCDHVVLDQNSIGYKTRRAHLDHLV